MAHRPRPLPCLIFSTSHLSHSRRNRNHSITRDLTSSPVLAAPPVTLILPHFQIPHPPMYTRFPLNLTVAQITILCGPCNLRLYERMSLRPTTTHTIPLPIRSPTILIPARQARIRASTAHLSVRRATTRSVTKSASACGCSRRRITRDPRQTFQVGPQGTMVFNHRFHRTSGSTTAAGDASYTSLRMCTSTDGCSLHTQMVLSSRRKSNLLDRVFLRADFLFEVSGARAIPCLGLVGSCDPSPSAFSEVYTPSVIRTLTRTHPHSHSFLAVPSHTSTLYLVPPSSLHPRYCHVPVHDRSSFVHTLSRPSIITSLCSRCR